jgi:tetratricopeptide (TPR) repeat protein
LALDLIGGVALGLLTILLSLRTYQKLTGALLSSLPNWLERLSMWKGVPLSHLQQYICCLMFIILIIFGCITCFLFPHLQNRYFNKGKQYYCEDKNYEEALDHFKNALVLNPNHCQTHFFLGLLYDDMQDQPTALSEFQLAVKTCINKDSEMYNNALLNSARLHILNKEYNKAISILERLIDSSDDAELNYYIYKNLGWVLFAQQKMERAKIFLMDAIEIAINLKIEKEKQASAYCILAQVNEKLEKDSEETVIYWENCRNFNHKKLPEEKIWYDLAQRKLSSGG